MQYHRAIVGRSSRLETCNPPDQPVPLIPSSLYYQQPEAPLHCTALHCEYEATKMLMMDAMVCCISSVAVQNGDWKESADCRSNAEGSLQRLKQSLIESGTQVNSRLVIISFNFSFSWTVDPSVLPVRPVKEKKMALEMIINIIVAIYTT